MATYVSKQGKWVPAKEVIGLKNMSNKAIKYNGQMIEPGEPFVYKGPDREAMAVLAKEGVDHLGKDFRDDNDFLDFLHNSRFKGDMDAYFKSIRYNQEEEDKKFAQKAATVKAHEIPKKVEEIRVLAGGRDTTGEKANNVVGGFGAEKLRPEKE